MSKGTPMRGVRIADDKWEGFILAINRREGAGTLPSDVIRKLIDLYVESGGRVMYDFDPADPVRIARLGSPGLVHLAHADSDPHRVGGSFRPACPQGPVYDGRPYVQTTDAVTCPDCAGLASA